MTGDATIRGPVAPTSTMTFTGNLMIAAGGVFAPLPTTIVAGNTSVLAGGTLRPSGSAIGTFAAKNLQSAGHLAFDLTNPSQLDQIVLSTGTVDVTGSTLDLTTSPSINIGDSFTLTSNLTGTSIAGLLANGATVTSLNNPWQLFTINTAGGTNGNDIVVTLSQILTHNRLALVGGQLIYGGGASLNNQLTVDLATGMYTFTDPSGPIDLSPELIAALWTGDGTSSVSGPASAVTNVVINSSDGNDSITLDNLANPFTIDGGGQSGDSVTVAGTLSFTGNASITGITTLAATNGGKIISPTGTLSLSATGTIGDSNNPLATQVAAANVTAAGTVWLTEADGLNLTATVTGGDLNVQNLAGTLAIVGATSTSGGAVNLSSGDAVVVSANLSAGSSTISIAANTDGVGTDGFSQTLGLISTTNTTQNAVQITVNTGSGGTGNAILDNTSIGDASGGTLNINSNGGSIVFARNYSLSTAQLGLAGGDSATPHVLIANSYVFTATGAGSIGSDSRPIQAFNNAGGGNGFSLFTLNAGNGGVYFTDWNAVVTLLGASATGAGNIRIVAANAGSHNMFVNGPVTAQSGNIYLAADDDLTITAPIGGGSFSGTVYLAANRDLGNGLNLHMDAGASIVTSNTSPTAVVLEGFSTNGTATGGIRLNSITVGDGGTINVSTVPTSQPGSHGFISTFNSSVVLNAGLTGTVILTASPYAAGGSTDAIGGATASSPVIVTAGTVIATSTPNAAGNGGIFVTATGSTTFIGTMNATGANTGTINFVTQAGSLTIGAPLVDNGAAINLTGAAGVILNAVVGSSSTGAINITGPLSGAGAIVMGTGALTINQNVPSTYTGSISGSRNVVKNGSGTLTLAGSSGFTGGTSINAGSLIVDGTLSATSGVFGQGTLGGTGTVTATILSGNVDPGDAASLGILSANGVSFAGGSTLSLQIHDRTSGAGVGYDQLNVFGSVALSSVPLNVVVTGTPTVGDSFVLVNNDGADSITGQFASGTTLLATDPTGTISYTFSINYQGGDGNDVVATLLAFGSFPLLDFNQGVASFVSGTGMNDDITTSISGANYIVRDAAGSIRVTPAAAAAGWTTLPNGDIQGPTAGVTSFAFQLSNGSDRIEGLDAGSAVLSLSYTGNLTMAGAVNAAAVNITGSGTLDFESTVAATADIIVNSTSNIVAGTAGKLIGNNVVVTATGIGSPSQPLLTRATTIVVTAGNGGVAIVEDDGANLSASVTGSGNLIVTNNTGLLAIGTAGVSTGGGTISLSSGDGIALGGNVNAGSGSIAIAANTDGVGSDGLSQTSGQIKTTNTGSPALQIVVNTSSGGTGNATLGDILVGSTSGGTLTVNSNGGSILYAGATLTDQQRGVVGGGSAPAVVMQAHDYFFTATGAGSIGTDALPIQTTNFGTDTQLNGSNFTLNAGDGGAYLVDWGTVDVTLNSATATGPGSVRVVAGSGTGHNLYVNGNVSAVSGNIYLAGDDNIAVSAGVVIGGAGFSGTVWMQANRDQGSVAQTFLFDPTASIRTSNTTNVPTGTRTPATQAVYLDISGDQGTPSVLVVGNITTGDGGRIVLNAIPNGIGSEAGQIYTPVPSIVLDAGPTGTIELTAGISATVAADAIGISGQPIAVAGGNVIINDNYGNVYVVGASATTFSLAGTASVAGQTSTIAVNLSTTTGTLTVASAGITIPAGTLNLTGADQVAINGPVSAGAISISGALSGSGNIALGSAALSLSQSTSSTYGGVISGNQPVFFNGNGTGVLTMTGANAYTGGTSVASGSLVVNGSLAGAVSVAAGATLGGTGSVGDVAASNATVNPGSQSPGPDGTLTVGSFLLGGGTLFLNLDGTSSYDSVKVTGSTIDISNTNLTLAITPSSISGGDKYTILSNPNGDAIAGMFVGTSEGSTITVSGKAFTITYAGGASGHDVILTAQSSGTTIVNGYPALNANPHNLPQYSYIAHSGQHSMVESVVYSFSSSVSLAKSDFTITNKGPANIGGSNFAAYVPDLVVTGSDNNTLWTVTFANHVVGGHEQADGVSDTTGSIGDGKYELVLNAAGGLTDTYDFYRLLGDVNHRGTVDGPNFQAFITAFNQTPGSELYVGAFDFDGGYLNPTVNGADFQTLVTNFNHTVGDITGFN